MKRLWPKVCLPLALMALVVLPTTAYANRHLKVSGEIVFVPSAVLVHTPIGGYTVHTDNLSGSITGTIESSQFLFIRTLIIHSNGDFDVTGTITATATMFGRSGGFTQRITGTGSTITGAVQGEWVLLNGTGGLAGLQGQGTFAGIAGQASDYSGMVWFEAN